MAITQQFSYNNATCLQLEESIRKRFKELKKISVYLDTVDNAPMITVEIEETDKVTRQDVERFINTLPR